MSERQRALIIASLTCFLLSVLIFYSYQSLGLMLEYPWGSFSMVQLVPILGVVLIIFGIIGLSVAYEIGKSRNE